MASNKGQITPNLPSGAIQFGLHRRYPGLIAFPAEDTRLPPHYQPSLGIRIRQVLINRRVEDDSAVILPNGKVEVKEYGNSQKLDLSLEEAHLLIAALKEILENMDTPSMG